jgi:hypothetical protein
MDRLTKVTAVASGVAGLVVYVYVLGGLVVWARLTATRLYTDSAVDALGNKSLLATGLKVVAFELVALAVLSGLAWVLWRGKVDLQTTSTNDKKGLFRVGWLIVQGILVAFVAACGLALASIPPVWALIAGGLWVLVGLVFMDSDFVQKIAGTRLLRWVKDHRLLRWVQNTRLLRWVIDHRLLRWVPGVLVVVAAICFSAAAPGITALILFVLVLNNAWFEKRLVDPDIKRLIAPVAVILVALSVIVLAFLATPPVTFDRMIVLMKHGKTVEGGYVARSGDDVFVATCKQYGSDVERSKLPRLQVVPNDSVKQVILGGDRYAIDNGKRPSLLDLGLHLFSQDPIEQHFRAWRPSIRGRLAVCGTKPSN